MPDFTFYREVYLGSRIPEAQFAELAARAAQVLDGLKRRFRVEGGEQAQAMAVCAMAECLLTQRSRKGVHSANVGSVRVQYENARQRELYEAAGVYLDIYRGVE